MPEGALYLISTPIGHLGDITRRALEVLEGVDVVYAEDTRHTAGLLRHFGLSTPVRSLHEHNESARCREVLDKLRAGADVALASDAGTPTVSDPGSLLVRAVAEAGLRVVPIPGPSAVTAALAASGLPAGRFLFLGFSPRKGSAREAWMREIAAATLSVVVFESPRRIVPLLREWSARGLGERQCVVCRELTKIHEEIRHGTVDGLADYYSGQEVRGEVTVVLAGGPRSEGREIDLEEAGRLVEDLARQGLTTKEIAARLQADCGMSRNQAYALALGAEDAR